MPYMRQQAKSRKQPAMDDLEITRLQAISKIPPHIVGKPWETLIRRSQMRVRRKVIRVRVGSVVHICEISSYDSISELSAAHASFNSTQDSPPSGLHRFACRATSEPPSLGSPYCDSEAIVPPAQASSSDTRSSRSISPSSSSGSSNSIAASMSRRRITSNIPFLDSRVCMPPAFSADAFSDPSSSGLSSGSLTPSLSHSLSDLLLSGAPSIPRTPACQLIREQHSPPEAPRQPVLNARRKVSLPLSQSLRNAAYPFTPLEDGTSPQLLPPNIKSDPLSGLETLLHQQCQVQHASTPPILSSSSLVGSQLARAQVTDQLRRRALPVAIRSLSSNSTNSGLGSPSPRLATAQRLSMLQSNGLASPVILDGNVPSLASPRIMQLSPLQQSTGLPSAPGYFNMPNSSA